jgi:bifunctional DNase/RNase
LDFGLRILDFVPSKIRNPKSKIKSCLDSVLGEVYFHPIEEPFMAVQMELHKIIISEMADQQFIVLKEVDGERKFPIVIGNPEAYAIDRRLKGMPTPRPLTHDLLANVIEEMGGTLEQIVINNLQEHTFFARIHIRRNGQVIEVDSRPSDAIALGVATSVPIFVAEHVLDEVARE